jgi:hypothetical protein
MSMKSERDKARPRGGHRFRWAIWFAAALVAVGSVFVIVVAIKSPFTRDRVAQSLEENVRAKVTFGKFRMVYFPHPGCVAEGVTFVRSGSAENTAPLVTVQRVEIEAHYLDIIARPGYVAMVKLNGLHVQVPPPGTAGASSSSGEISPVRVGEIVADGAVLEVARSDDKAPLKFEMHSLTVRSFAHDSEWTYHVSMKNPEPPGEITAEGKFGPLNLDDLVTTPLSGTYKFQQADLGVFNGIAGTLSSTGDFAGKLGEIGVRGTIDIPDFQVLRSKHPAHVTSRFNATVNAKNGDVLLKQVESSFLHTSVAASGRVAGKAGQKGKTTSLDLEVNHGRIQDLLLLLASTKHASMNGVTSFKAHVTILPLGRPFLKELVMTGDFGVEDAAFRKPSRQAQVQQLSERARGEKTVKDKDKSKTKPEADIEDPENVVIDLQGHLELREGVAKFTELSFNVPGASARMDGTYNLLDQRIDFHGTLKTQAELSQDTTGIKSALLKPLNPLFKGKKAGAVIPVKMTGTYHNPSFGFDAVGAIKAR